MNALRDWTLIVAYSLSVLTQLVAINVSAFMAMLKMDQIAVSIILYIFASSLKKENMTGRVFPMIVLHVNLLVC